MQTPFSHIPTPEQQPQQPIVATRCIDPDSLLRFAHLTRRDAHAIAPLLAMSPSRTCDFTIGGMIMWADYFRYDAAIRDDTLFVRGVTENDITHTAYSLPVGRMPLPDALDIIRRQCYAEATRPVLSAVPADRLDEVLACGPARAEELVDWADYLYDINVMASFAGKKMAKKRNHVHRFHNDHPDAIFRPVTDADIPALIAMTDRLHLGLEKSLSAEYERMATADLLANIREYPGFEAALLEVPGRGIVAFTVGEVMGDTLFAHIEKIDHDVNGAGETVSSSFCAMMLDRHPQLRFVNREEDTGDLGLRRAKEEYHPLRLLRKYNVELL